MGEGTEDGVEAGGGGELLLSFFLFVLSLRIVCGRRGRRDGSGRLKMTRWASGCMREAVCDGRKRDREGEGRYTVLIVFIFDDNLDWRDIEVESGQGESSLFHLSFVGVDSGWLRSMVSLCSNSSPASSCIIS